MNNKEYEEPGLCDEGFAFIRTYFSELLKLLDKVEDANNTSEVCNYYKQLSELYNSKEPIQEWCHSRKSCGSPSILALCHVEVSTTIARYTIDPNYIEIDDIPVTLKTAITVEKLYTNYANINCDELNSGDKPDD